jgi:uncharacterized membrane protein
MQRSPDMQTKTSVKGHPPHPMLVVFPIALYIVGLASLVAYICATDVFWYRAAYLAMLTGAGVAVVAAVFGAIDAIALPRDSRAKQLAIVHGGAAIAATALFLGASMAMRSHWVGNTAPAMLPVALPLALSISGLALLLAAGLLGWHLVAVYHVGVSPIVGRANASLPSSLEHAPHPHVVRREVGR